MKNSDLEQAINELSLASDVLFSTAFDNRPDRAIFLIKDILDYLGIHDFEIEEVKTQDRDSHLFQHDTINDIKIRLKDGKRIIYKIQLSHPENFPPERARYNFSSDDVEFLSEGKPYSELPTVIQVVISEKDLFKTGLPIYTSQRIIMETGKILPDRQTLVFLNKENQGEEKTPINLFINDIFETDYNKISNPIARETLKNYKEKKEEYMRLEGHLKEVFDREHKEMYEEIEKLKKENKRIEYLEKENKRIDSLEREIKQLKEQLAQNNRGDNKNTN